MSDEITKKVNFSKSGTGGITPKINLKTTWVEEMGITKEENEVVMKFDEKKKEITIKKK